MAVDVAGGGRAVRGKRAGLSSPWLRSGTPAAWCLLSQGSHLEATSGAQYLAFTSEGS